ncbi:MAG: 23S rRNA pseudouridine(955/2504/2580) synthase RluC [Cellvibrionaceae bacterium]
MSDRRHSPSENQAKNPANTASNTSGAAVKVQLIEIDEDQAGQRLDNFLMSRLKGVPKSRIYRILRKGEVRVNKKRAKPEQRLEGGDVVRVPPVRVAERQGPAQAGKGLLELLETSILYESDALMIINKPSGLAVHGGSGISLGLIEALRQMRPDARFLELVHRLDKDTSGCIMIAKKRSMLRHLHEVIREKKVDKIYNALVVGRWPNRKKQVDAPLQKNELKSGERVVRVDPQGKASLTEFKVLERFGDDFTLVEAMPITGRTHQIRVHGQFAGHPLIGDDKYGVDEVNKAVKNYGLKRLFLHAAALRVPLPGEKKLLQVSAPLGDELATGLEKLRQL